MEPHTVEFERLKTLKIRFFFRQKNLDMPAADSLTEFHEREKDSSPIRSRPPVKIEVLARVRDQVSLKGVMKTLKVGIYADRHSENLDRVQIARNCMLSRQLPTRVRVDQN